MPQFTLKRNGSEMNETSHEARRRNHQTTMTQRAVSVAAEDEAAIAEAVAAAAAADQITLPAVGSGQGDQSDRE